MRAQNHPSTIFENEDLESNDNPRLTSSFQQRTGYSSSRLEREDLAQMQKRSCEAVISVRNKVVQIMDVFRRDVQTSLIEAVRDIRMEISHMQDKYSVWNQRQDRYFQKEPILISPKISKKSKKNDLKGQLFKKRQPSYAKTKASEQQYNLTKPDKIFQPFQQRKHLLQSVPFDEDELELTVKSMIEKELQCNESNRKHQQKRLIQTMIEEKAKHREQLRKEVKRHEEETQMIRENYTRQVQEEVIKQTNLEEGYRNKIEVLERSNFQIKRQLEEKLAQKQKSLCKMVSNSIAEHQDSFDFIVSSIESFTKKKIQKSQLVFQTDRQNRDIGCYLAELKQSSSPFCAIFFTASQEIFGVFSPYISINEAGDHNFKAFLFNANTKKTFVSNPNNNVYICPVSFVDNLLVMGNRELYLRNHKLETILINCGNIIGHECFRIRRMEILENVNSTQIGLSKVQLHKISFFES